MSKEKSNKRAEELFLSGLYCAESVVVAIAEKQGKEGALIKKWNC